MVTSVAMHTQLTFGLTESQEMKMLVRGMRRAASTTWREIVKASPLPDRSVIYDGATGAVIFEGSWSTQNRTAMLDAFFGPKSWGRHWWAVGNTQCFRQK